MYLPRLAFAAFFAAGFSFMPPATAAPLAAPDARPAVQSDIVQVRGCHSDVRRHYVPEFGRSVDHRHRRDCTPVRAGGGGSGGGARDCHRDAQRHFVPGLGRVVHRHVGPDCRVRVLRRYDNGGRNCVQIGPIRYCEG